MIFHVVKRGIETTCRDTSALKGGYCVELPASSKTSLVLTVSGFCLPSDVSDIRCLDQCVPLTLRRNCFVALD